MEPTLSSTVRAILQSKANHPIRVNALWDAVRATAPALAKTKTHFKTQIIGGMFRRDEVRRVAVRAAPSFSRTLTITTLSSSLPFVSQLVKLRVPDSFSGTGGSPVTPASSRLVYAVRLKGSGAVRRKLAEHGLTASANMGGPALL